MNTNDTPEGDDFATQPLDHTTTQPAPTVVDSPLRRHSVGIAITAGVLAVIVVAGGTAWGVSAAVAGSQTTASAPMAAASHSTGAKAGKHGKSKAHGAVGTITAINGDTWTLNAASGATLTVKLSSTTAFGTKKAPSTASSFAVGDKVGALGSRAGDTVTATRIVHAPAQAHMSTSTPAPTAGT
ncbi:DUF5666 domain-containing protein [Leifsonia sp. 2MCAF36]|uniref:DUF5666 domain-containing protein n=1 Tax=Leifsonia sp. 2MCAF36 TaxID=3232988 RepID=UPI003F97AAC4